MNIQCQNPNIVVNTTAIVHYEIIKNTEHIRLDAQKRSFVDKDRELRAIGFLKEHSNIESDRLIEVSYTRPYAELLAFPINENNAKNNAIMLWKGTHNECLTLLVYLLQSTEHYIDLRAVAASKEIPVDGLKYPAK